jgi:hypothetical protein
MVIVLSSLRPLFRRRQVVDLLIGCRSAIRKCELHRGRCFAASARGGVAAGRRRGTSRHHRLKALHSCHLRGVLKDGQKIVALQIFEIRENVVARHAGTQQLQQSIDGIP